MRVWCLWSHGCCGRRRARLWGRAARCARGRRPARWCSDRRVACLDGPGRCVCRWAAARPRAVRAASFARRVVSKPGQAPPPPTGAAAWPTGALHTGGAGSLMCGSARRLEARFWLPNSNSARNSRFTVSNFEFVSLELQRFREVLNNDRDKLRAKFIRCLSHRCAWSSAAGSTNPSAREAMGGFAALEAGWRRISGVSQL